MNGKGVAPSLRGIDQSLNGLMASSEMDRNGLISQALARPLLQFSVQHGASQGMGWGLWLKPDTGRIAENPQQGFFILGKGNRRYAKERSSFLPTLTHL